MIWSLGSTIKDDSRNKFDTFLRKIILGNNDQHPKPQTFKLSKSNLFPESGTVYDFVYDKKNNGSWIQWSEKLDLKRIPPDARVNTLLIPKLFMFFNIKNNFFKLLGTYLLVFFFLYIHLYPTTHITTIYNMY